MRTVLINFKIGFGSDYVIGNEEESLREENNLKEILDLLSLSGQTLHTVHLTLSQIVQPLVFRWIQARISSGQFPNLRRLSLQNVPLISTSKNDAFFDPSPTSTSTSIQSLSIFSAQFKHQFNHLKHLNLSMLLSSDLYSSIQELLKANPELQSLELGHSVLLEFGVLVKRRLSHGQAVEVVELPNLTSLCLSPRSPTLSTAFSRTLNLPKLQTLQGDPGSLAGLNPTSCKALSSFVVWLDGSSAGQGGIKQLQKTLSEFNDIEKLSLRGRPERRSYSQVNGFLKLLCKPEKSSDVKEQSTTTTDFRGGIMGSEDEKAFEPKLNFEILTNLKRLTIGEELVYEKKTLLKALNSRAEAGRRLGLAIGLKDLNPEEVKELIESGVVENLRIIGDE